MSDKDLDQLGMFDDDLPAVNQGDGQPISADQQPSATSSTAAPGQGQDKRANPCLTMFGPGPVGRRCKECLYLVKFQQAVTYHKCEQRRGKYTRWGSTGTDHLVNWPACARFKSAEVARLAAQRDELYERLMRGVAVIEQARDEGKDPALIERWEVAWLKLLAEYERVCDELASLDPEA